MCIRDRNSQGQVGNGTYTNVFEPAIASGTVNPVTLHTGLEHTCTLVGDGRIQCWGSNQDGQLGNGDSTTDVPLPAPVQGLGPVADFAGGGYHACAIMSDR